LLVKSLWNDAEAVALLDNPLEMRVYTSRLLGRETDLVLHGGGNTSVKTKVQDLFGDEIDVIYVKGSGWDLATIEARGFAPCRLQQLRRLATLDQLTDGDMVRAQRSAMIDPGAPTPSVEAILHAIIPFDFVDHTHADAVVTITNTTDGEARIRAIFRDRVLVIPYVMPGFVLAKAVQDSTRDIDWSRYDGMILMNHGVFTWGDSGKTAYERMVRLVSAAEEYLDGKGATAVVKTNAEPIDPVRLAAMRLAVSLTSKGPVLAVANTSPEAAGFSSLATVADVAGRGPLTPDHVIRTKRVPLIVGGSALDDVADYVRAYTDYFQRHDDGQLTQLDAGPKWAVWPGHGTVCFGRTPKEARIIDDITTHTMRAIQEAESLGGWHPLPEKELFDIEYWELEQAKLRKAGSPPELTGRVAIVTGAAAGIGRACVNALHTRGACVVALDVKEAVLSLARDGVEAIVCDVTNEAAVNAAVTETVRCFGGLDIVVSNAGIFPSSQRIAQVSAENWQRSMDVNLNAHRLLLQAAIPYLELGIEAAVVIVGSKNVPAPGRGAAAYSVAKAGLTQLARVAALELGERGIRVNTIHPNNVFDTGIWTDEVLEERAKHYNMTVDEYKSNNVLRSEVTSTDVAAAVCALVGPAFARTTGAQVPVDGGNDRVI